jgi:glycosyltransferase involved in cell wall biosynthesis
MTVFLVDLEAVETRYTGQWKTHVPNLLKENGHNVRIISGPVDIPTATTPGAFLNFGGTNIYKARQVEIIGRLFCDGAVSDGDHFLFTDAWHPGIINLKYMSELLGIKVTIHALWHAGSYDPQDFLGRLIGDAPWVRHAEQSFFHAIDHNYFATDFHIDLFAESFSETTDDEWKMTMIEQGKIVRTGWPMEYMSTEIVPFQTEKRDLILFPHRLAPEKQVEIFRDLAQTLPQYEFVVCQDQQLTKDEYHTLLGQAKMVFSANLQETLGISCYEGMLVGAIPLVPDRLSYKEMYGGLFKYPSEWTESWDSYVKHKEELKRLICEHIENFDARHDFIRSNAEHLTLEFFSATNILETISGHSISKD